MNTIFKPGFHIYELPVNKGSWQIALFTIGRDVDDDDHEGDRIVTWFVQFAFWQFTFSRIVEL